MRDEKASYEAYGRKMMIGGALRSHLSSPLLERFEERFSAAPSPMVCVDTGCCSRVVALLLVFRRAVMLVLDNGVDSRKTI